MPLTRTMNTQQNQRNRDEIHYYIHRHVGNIGRTNNGWVREVNVVSWNGHKPGIDIRHWNPDHSRMSKGVNLTYEEAETLSLLLASEEFKETNEQKAETKKEK